jgi:large subunit ribosomal protein L24e
MAAAREKVRAHRKKMVEGKPSVKLVQPLVVQTPEKVAVREKIKVSVKTRSALIPGEGRSMGMDID